MPDFFLALEAMPPKGSKKKVEKVVEPVTKPKEAPLVKVAQWSPEETAVSGRHHPH